MLVPYIYAVPQHRLDNEWAIMQSRRAPTDDEWRIAKINHRQQASASVGDRSA